MIQRIIEHTQHEWPILFFYLFVLLQVYYHFDPWLVIPLVLLILRMILLRNKYTWLITFVLTIGVLTHSIVQSKMFIDIQNLPIDDQEIQVILITDPLDIQVSEKKDSISGKAQAIIVQNDRKQEIKVDFVKWLDEGETIPARITEKMSTWHVVAEMNYPSPARNFNVFDYKEYLATQLIACQLEIKEVKNVTSSQSIDSFLVNTRYKLLEKFIKLNHHEWLALHNKLLLNLNSTFYQAFKDQFSALGIAHFFAISGFHIYFIRRLLNYLLLRIGMRRELAENVIFIFLIFYAWLIRWPIGVIRVLLMNMLTRLKDLSDKSVSRLDILSLVGILLLIVNPLNVLSLGYTLSFMMTFIVIMYSQNSKHQGSFRHELEMTVSCLLLSWPIIMQISFEWNITQILLVIICSVFFNHLMMPMVFLTTLSVLISIPGMFGLTNLLDKLVLILNESINNFEILSHFERVVGKQHLLLFYLFILIAVLFLTFIHKYPYLSYCSTIILYFVIIICLPYLDPTTSITIIDVGQGDSTLIQIGHNRGNWLIDTGGKRLFEPIDNSYIDKSFAEKNIIPALKALGINRLDGIIITHPDIDHIGNLVPILNEIQVSEVWVSDYTANSEIWAEIEREIVGPQIIVLNQGMEYEHPIHPINLYSAPSHVIKYSDSESNDSSILVQFTIGNLEFLNLGDITQRVEKYFINQYPNIKGDILKLGHHGSNTSTSEQLLEALNPQLALISAGVNNQYGHPHEDVVEILNDFYITYLSTETVGAIRISSHPISGYAVTTAIDTYQ